MISNDCPFIFKFNYEPPYRNGHLWSAMINIIPLLDLCFLNIAVCNEPKDFLWRSLFEGIGNFKCVEVAFHSALKLFIAAYNATSAPEEAGSHHYDQDANTIPFPLLHSLSLDSIDDNSLLDELIDILTMHDKHGYRLTILSISKKPHLPNEWVAKLSLLVDKLEW